MKLTANVTHGEAGFSAVAIQCNSLVTNPITKDSTCTLAMDSDRQVNFVGSARAS